MTEEVKDAVLLVDDDLTFLKTASATLRKYYEVSAVSSGKEAIELIRSGYVPDLVLLDIDMPELDGFAAHTALREFEEMADVPVVFLTGLTGPESELKGMESGAEDYLTKPFIAELLLARVKRRIESGKRLRQLSVLEKDKIAPAIDETKFRRFAADLNDTEKKILRLIIQGYTNREICETLHYAYGYVKNCVGVIYEKKAVSKRSDLKKLLMM